MSSVITIHFVVMVQYMKIMEGKAEKRQVMFYCEYNNRMRILFGIYEIFKELYFQLSRVSFFHVLFFFSWYFESFKALK